jgi:hypothetical protein
MMACCASASIPSLATTGALEMELRCMQQSAVMIWLMKRSQ